MAFGIKNGAQAKKPTEFELHVSKKTGRVTVRAYNPNNGKKYSLLSFRNGTAGDTGAIILHGRNQGLGFRTNSAGVPATEVQS